MISSDVIFGTYSSREDLHLTFTHADKGAPDVHTEYVEVPGREPVDLSELMIGFPQYQNRTMTIEFEYLGPDWEPEKMLVLSKLHGRKMEIRFLNDPDWYYIGRCLVTSEVNMSTLHFTIDVTAEPYKRFYDETAKELTADGTVFNPTDFTAYPLIKVNGTGDGSFTIGNKTVSIDNIDGYMYIDSELMDCYKGPINMNPNVTLTEFPKLAPGINNITFTGDITSLEILGRWRAL